MKLSDINIEAFAAHLHREEKSAATLDKYLRDVRGFRSYSQDREITKELVSAWKKSLMDRAMRCDRSIP